MPGPAGATLREIKSVYPEMTVIIMTAFGEVESAVQAMKLGAFDYLLKPIKFEELLQKIASAFEKKAGFTSTWNLNHNDFK